MSTIRSGRGVTCHMHATKTQLFGPVMVWLSADYDSRPRQSERFVLEQRWQMGKSALRSRNDQYFGSLRHFDGHLFRRRAGHINANPPFQSLPAMPFSRCLSIVVTLLARYDCPMGRRSSKCLSKRDQGGRLLSIHPGGS